MAFQNLSIFLGTRQRTLEGPLWQVESVLGCSLARCWTSSSWYVQSAARGTLSGHSLQYIVGRNRTLRKYQLKSGVSSTTGGGSMNDALPNKGPTVSVSKVVPMADDISKHFNSFQNAVEARN